MPRGPKGEKRPADVIGNAVKVMKIAVGEESEDAPANTDISQSSESIGRLGGKARAVSLTPQERKAIAKRAAAVRWKKN